MKQRGKRKGKIFVIKQSNQTGCVYAEQGRLEKRERAPPPGVDTRIHLDNEDEGWVRGSGLKNIPNWFLLIMKSYIIEKEKERRKRRRGRDWKKKFIWYLCIFIVLYTKINLFFILKYNFLKYRSKTKEKKKRLKYIRLNIIIPKFKAWMTMESCDKQSA